MAAALPAQQGRTFLRGICFCRSTLERTAEKQIVDFVTSNRINLVAIDFFNPAFHRGGGGWSRIRSVVKRLRRHKVVILADYRVATGPPGKLVKKDQPDMCLSDPQVVRNIIGWGNLILEKVPGIDILTIYNPLPRFERNKQCPRCSKRNESAILAGFVASWSKGIKAKHGKVKVGVVLPGGASIYRPLAKHLDIFVPFCSLIAPRGRKSCGPGVMEKAVTALRPLRRKGPVIPLVKLYWKHQTRNTTADILAAMSEARSAGADGFFLWYWALINGQVAKNVRFKLPEYDLAKIEERYRLLGGGKKRKRR